MSRSLLLYVVRVRHCRSTSSLFIRIQIYSNISVTGSENVQEDSQSGITKVAKRRVEQDEEQRPLGPFHPPLSLDKSSLAFYRSRARERQAMSDHKLENLVTPDGFLAGSRVSQRHEWFYAVRQDSLEVNQRRKRTQDRSPLT